MLQDIRYSVRTLLKTPGFVAVAVLTLALGIGANTAMFSVIKAVLLARLPYPEPGRLVQIWETNKSGKTMWVSTPNFADWQAQNGSLETMAYADHDVVTLSGSGTPDRVRLSIVSRNFFRVFGVAPELGRYTSSGDHSLGAAPVLVVSHAIWVRDLGANPAAIGRVLRINGQPYTVIGVMPTSFDFPERSEVWMPREIMADHSTRSAHNHQVFARLKPGLSLASAQADMNTVGARLAQSYIDDHDHGIRVNSLYEEIVGPVRPALMILLGAVGFVLLIACVNLANLQMARGSTRVREMALRSALGAVRTRLIRQLLTESTLLALAGGVAGLIVAVWGTQLLRATIPSNIPRIENIHMDLGVLAFTVALSFGAGLLFGVLPALSASQTDVTEALKEGSGKATLSAGVRRLGGGLVIIEIAVAMVLLVGAGLLIQTFRNLERVDPGFATKGLLTAEVAWPVGPTETDQQRADLLSSRLLDRVRALSGVEKAGAINSFPIKESGSDGNFEIAGRPLPGDPHLAPDAYYRVATTGYFEAMGIPLIQGRLFTAADENPAVPKVALVNQSFVQEFFPHANPIGQRIRFFGFDDHPQFLQIVGVVRDVHSINLRDTMTSEVFVEGFQHPGELSSPTLVVRGDLSSIASIRSVVRSIDPNVPAEFRSVQAILGESVSRQRFQMSLLSIFASLALLLSAIGIYGVQSYTVTRRTGELGIRLALGSSRGQVLALVLKEGLILAGAGIALGSVGALLLTRTLAGLLFGVQASDLFTFLSIGLLLAITALIACILPARRAAGTDPMTALRYE